MQVQVDKEEELKVALILMKRTQYTECLESLLKITQYSPNLLFSVLVPIYKYLSLHFNNNHLRIIITELYLSQNYYKEALDELEEAYEIDPHFSQTYFILAKIYNRTSEKKRIQSLFESAFENHIYDSAILDLLPKIYFEEKNISKNIQLFETLIAYDPKKLHYYKTLAELYKSVQQYDKAANLIQKMVELSPQLAPDATKFCETLMRRCPMNFSLRQILISLYWKSCEPEKSHLQIQELCRLDTSYIPVAIKDYQAALKIFPHHKDLLMGLATLLIETSAYSESTEAIQELYQFHPDHLTAILPLLQTILERYPSQFYAIKLCIQIYYDQEKIDDCMSLLSQLIDTCSRESEFILEKIHHIENNHPHLKNQCKLLTSILHLKLSQFKECLVLVKELKDTDFNIKAKELEILAHIELEDVITAQRLCLEAMESHFDTEIFHTLLTTIQSQLINRRLNDLSSETDKELFEIGLLLLRKGDLYSALEKFQNITPDSEFNLKSQVLISRCFLELDNYDNASKHITRCLNLLDPNEKEYRCQLLFFNTIVKLQSGKYKEAIGYMEDILSIDIKYPYINPLLNQYKSAHLVGLRGIGLSLAKASQDNHPWHIITVPNAEELQSKTTQDINHMSFALPHNNQGADYLIQNNLSAAKAEFKLAIQMDPGLTIAHTNLAIIYLIEKSYSDSLKQLDKAEALNPSLDLIHQLRGLNYQEMNHIELSVKHFQKAIRNTPNLLTYLNLGDLYYQQGRLKLAFSHWRKALESPLYFYLLQRRLLYLNTESLQITDWISPVNSYIHTLLNPLQE